MLLGRCAGVFVAFSVGKRPRSGNYNFGVAVMLQTGEGGGHIRYMVIPRLGQGDFLDSFTCCLRGGYFSSRMCLFQAKKTLSRGETSITFYIIKGV